MDKTISHNVNLIKYIKQTSSLVQELNTKIIQYQTSGRTEHLLPHANVGIEPPPLSMTSQDESTRHFFSESFNLEKNKSLDQSSKMKFLQKSVAVMCLQNGLETCESHVLDVLTDVLDNFFKIVSTQMKLASVDRGVNEDLSNDLFEFQKILVETGAGNLTDVVNFQESNFVERNKSLIREAEALYGICVEKQERMKKQLLLHTPGVVNISSPNVVNITSPNMVNISSPMDLNEVLTSKKKKKRSRRSSDESDFLNFFNPTKKSKI